MHVARGNSCFLLWENIKWDSYKGLVSIKESFSGAWNGACMNLFAISRIYFINTFSLQFIFFQNVTVSVWDTKYGPINCWYFLPRINVAM